MRQTYCRLFKLLVLLFTALAAPATVHAQAPVIKDLRIEILETGADEIDRYVEIAESLIYIQKGQRFSDKEFSDSIDALRKSAVFQDIDVPDQDLSAPAITLVFRLTPFARIRNIIVSGGFPLLEREIRNVMTITTGKPYIPEEIPAQVDLIETLFRTEGFIDPEVTVDAEKLPDQKNYDVRVNIDKGRFYRTRKVILIGSNSFTDLRLQARMTTWQSSFLIGGPSRFIDKDLEKDIETIRNFYWREGYCDAEVEAKVDKDSRNETAVITFNIKEGPRYDVDILGNEFYWDFTLDNDLVIYERGNRGGFGLRKSVRNMEGRYRDDGFLDAAVEMEEAPVETGGEPVRKIRFIITEGPRYIVEKLTVEGSKGLTEEQVRDQMLTAPAGTIFGDGTFDPDTLEEDLRAIKTLYLQNGYLKTAIVPKIEQRKNGDSIIEVNLRISITEGPQTVVSGLAINGTERLKPEEIQDLLAMRLETPYRPYLLNESKNAIAARISEKGFPHVTVESEVAVSPDNTRADIVYQVAEGPYVQMGKTFFAGNFETKPSILNREIDLEEGEPFSLREMLASQRNIRNINALDSAQFQTIGLEEKSDRVDLLAEVHEKKPYYVQLTSGYDTWRRFYVDTSVGDINFLGLNKEIKAGLQWSEIGYLTEVGITDPNFRGTRIAANATLYAEEIEELNQEFGVRTHGAAAAFTREFLDDFFGSLNFRFEQREQFRTGEIDPIDEEFFDPRSVLVTTPGIVYNNTDSFVRPTRGFFSSYKIDISKGIKNSLDDFFKHQFDARIYYTPLKRVTVALRGFTGYIDPFGSESSVPQDQLFYLGGTADVRGYDENSLRTDVDGNPVGGRSAFLGSLELRFDVGWNFELVTFYDTGAVLDPSSDAGTDAWRAGAGAGLRYITAIGPIGVMYGRKIDRRENEDAGAIHFSLGYTF